MGKAIEIKIPSNTEITVLPLCVKVKGLKGEKKVTKNSSFSVSVSGNNRVLNCYLNYNL